MPQLEMLDLPPPDNCVGMSWQKWFQLCNWEAGCLLHAFFRKHKLTCVEDCWSIEYQSSFLKSALIIIVSRVVIPHVSCWSQFHCSAVNCKPPLDFVAFMVDFMAQIYIFQKGRAFQGKACAFQRGLWMSRSIHWVCLKLLNQGSTLKPSRFPDRKYMKLRCNILQEQGCYSQTNCQNPLCQPMFFHLNSDSSISWQESNTPQIVKRLRNSVALCSLYRRS